MEEGLIMNNYELPQEELDILCLLVQGETEIEAGIGYDLDEVMEEANRIINR
jgi:hypothetical protein